MENIKINSYLLQQLSYRIKTISESYDRLNEASGTNFNIFSILRIESDEVTTHSRFIAMLLDTKGVHGKQDQFLRLFLKHIIDDYNFITTKTATVSVEAHQGKVTETQGGTIDILIKDGDARVIMIENKIYAGEQQNQLLRYRNAFPKEDTAKLLFLTLYGRESEEESSQKIKYEQISYASDILKWVEECKKIAVDNPTLRETLTQYINLIKKLTNQNPNANMSTEIAKIFIENEMNFDIFNKSKRCGEFLQISYRRKANPRFRKETKRIKIQWI